jgi:hypothetical protein
MKTLLVSFLLALPAAVSAQDLNNADLDSLPGSAAMKAAAAEDSAGPVQRPDSAKIMAELSATLRLSSKQEERISAAVNKKSSEFDKLMKEFEKNSVEEKKWRYKMNETRHRMQTITRDMPDTVRDYLDDEQRQTYDGMLEAASKPAPAEAPALEPGRPAPEAGAVKVLKKRRVLRRKKAAAAPAGDEAGQVMVDKEPAAAKPPVKKRRVLRRKAAPTPAAVPAEDIPAGKPAGAQPTGKEAPPAEEDAGSYP